MRKVKRNGRTSWAKCFAVVTAAALLGLCCAGLIACGGHTHALEKVAGKAATCTEAGSKDYWTCDGCDGLFADADGSKTIASDEIAIAAKGHSLGKVSAVAATCTATGVRAHWKCNDCDALFSDADGKTATTSEAIKIAKTAHDIAAVNAKSATCTATGVRAHWKCNDCGTLFSDADGKTVTKIEDVTIAKTAHNYELNVTVAPGIFIEGEKLTADKLAYTLKCDDCATSVSVTEGVDVDLSRNLVAGENSFTATYDDYSKTFTVTAVAMQKLSVTDNKVTITNSDAKKVGLKTQNDKTFLSGTPNDYYGRLFVKYNLGAEENTQAKLYLNTCIREYVDKDGNRIDIKMSDVYSLKVNGREMTLGDDVKMPQADAADWFAQAYTCAGEVTLSAGQNNVVEITRKNLLYFGTKAVYGRYTYNFFGIGITPYTDTAITVNESCAHVCPHCGKCTDTDSANTNPMCADKCAGHESEHFCEHVCNICGGCRDDACQNTVCAEKCGCEELTVMHDSVTAVDSKGATVAKNTKPNEQNISANDSGAKKGEIIITYTITSNVDTTAKLYIKTSSQTIENSLADSYSFKVGETPVTVDGSIMMPYNEANKWNDKRYTYVGEVNLTAGANTIVITRPDVSQLTLNDYRGFNFFGIALSGAGTFSFPA